MNIEWANESFTLLPQRAVHWPRTSTLIIADTHFGKSAAFRSAGIPVPTGVTTDDLARLDDVLNATAASRLIILGDFFHARSGRAEQTLDVLARWRDARSELDIVLTSGNHDRHAGKPPAEWRIDCVSELADSGIRFCHEPCDAEDLYVMAGHVHPAVSLSDVAGGRLRAPCFWFGARTALLPAFGSFTGSASVSRKEARVFAIGPGVVVEV